MIVRLQLDHLKKDGCIQSFGERIKTLAQALLFEFDGRQPLRNEDLPLELPGIKRWKYKALTPETLLYQRFFWLWTTIIDLGPAVFWQEWWAPVAGSTALVERLKSIWTTETCCERTMKCFVGEVFFVGLDRLVRLVNGAKSAGGKFANHSIFPSGRPEWLRPGGQEDADETPRSFDHVPFDLRLKATDFLVQSSDV